MVTGADAYVVIVQHDNGCCVVRKTAVVKAINEAEAFKKVENKLHKTADDLIAKLSIHRLGIDEVVVTE